MENIGLIHSTLHFLPGNTEEIFGEVQSLIFHDFNSHQEPVPAVYGQFAMSSDHAPCHLYDFSCQVVAHAANYAGSSPCEDSCTTRGAEHSNFRCSMAVAVATEKGLVREWICL